MGAREYDGRIGRWLTKDPILFRGRSTNLYIYATNDPVNFVDPLGFARITVNFYKGVNLYGVDLGHTSITVDGKTYDPYWPDGERTNPPIAPIERIDIKVSDEDLKNLKDYLKNYNQKNYVKQNPYDPVDRNCNDYVRDVLKKGGVNPPILRPHRGSWTCGYLNTPKRKSRGS